VPDDALRAWIGGRLAPHKRPRRIAWVERLPLTPGNKLDRRALPESAARLRAL
jgi:acyl-coenzyme A synthetase/AMP-(fatty) acid ligase